jgi:hypothetical protein
MDRTGDYHRKENMPSSKSKMIAEHQWLMLAIVDTWEAEVGRITV